MHKIGYFFTHNHLENDFYIPHGFVRLKFSSQDCSYSVHRMHFPSLNIMNFTMNPLLITIVTVIPCLNDKGGKKGLEGSGLFGSPINKNVLYRTYTNSYDPNYLLKGCRIRSLSRPFQGKTGQSQNSYRSDIQSMPCVIFACTWWILLSGMAARTSWSTWVRHRRSSPPTLKQEMPRPSSVVSSKLGTQHTLNHQFTL